MTQMQSTWGKWQQTRNSLASSLATNINSRNATTPGSTSWNHYDRNITQTHNDMETHAMNGLRMVDLAAKPALVGQIKAGSEAAAKEAARLKEATDKLNEVTKLVTDLTALVAKFSAL